MARIVIASEAGACYGVERALQMVERAADEAAGPVHTLGPLIHNPRVVSDLAARGVTVVSSPEEAAGGTLLLTLNGVEEKIPVSRRRVSALKKALGL